LTQKAAALRVTKQFLVLMALREAGYHIADTDLVADERKARKKVTQQDIITAALKRYLEG
jgi:hypothetical protein